MTLRCGAGVSEEEVIEEWLRDFNNSDVELFKECLILARRQGSPLAEPLHRVARVVRQRQAFRRKATTALAMHRMSAIGIALCAVAIGAIQVAMNPQGIEVAIHHKSGARFLVGGVLFMIAGLGWMLRIGAREEVR
jgi:Flp pilus assembly protein TadB